ESGSRPSLKGGWSKSPQGPEPRQAPECRTSEYLPACFPHDTSLFELPTRYHTRPRMRSLRPFAVALLFGLADSTVRSRRRSGGSVFHERSYLRELHGRSDAIKLGHAIHQLRRKERLRRVLRFPDVEVERLPVGGINRERLGFQSGHAFKLWSCRLRDLPE